MALSFTVKRKTSPRRSARRRRVLVTGAAGRIGTYFAQNSHKRYTLRLMVREDEDQKTIKSLQRFGEVVKGDLARLDHLQKLCKGIDTIVHMAADPSPQASWDSLLQNNIVGTYHVFVAAKRAKCRRVIYASSIHAVSGYPADVQVKTSDPVNPGDMYGVSKCFGEALARYYAEQEGLSAIALRIGAFQPAEAARDASGIHMIDAWVSRRDLNHLIECCIDDETLTFAIFNGLSNNRFKRLDISDARQLVGYKPKDDLSEVNVQLKKLKLRERVKAHNVND